jgi:Flp pilus assembly pilin Flp
MVRAWRPVASLHEPRRGHLMKVEHKDKGQGLIEYAFIIILVSLVIIAVLALLGPAIVNTYQSIVDAI